MKLIQLIVLFFLCIGVVFADDTQNIEMIYSVLWQKTSAEYRALAYQAYNLAQFRLQEELKKSSDKPLAISGKIG